MPRRLAASVLLLVFSAWAANVKLYLKDGTFNLVREYQVKTDRVRYYSVERGEWEEIPLELVDLKRTESEAAARRAQLDADAKSLAEEEAAAREIQKEVSRIPRDPGVYWLDGKETRALKPASSSVHTNKGRQVLKVLSPIPMVTGKGTLELDGAHSQNVFTDPEHAFFIQLSDTERFGLARLTAKGAVRVVENLTFIPVTNDVEEELNLVDIFRQQLGNEDLYKIWPKEPLEPGEYAVVQYTLGKLNVQVWDFAIARAK
ncbi:MAG TPA: hypothetical protein VKF41_10255 [Bryobacteraceae bacterium]|nr:hypothetical protein [Bryobacteraceae bacterium]